MEDTILHATGKKKNRDHYPENVTRFKEDTK